MSTLSGFFGITLEDMKQITSELIVGMGVLTRVLDANNDTAAQAAGYAAIKKTFEQIAGFYNVWREPIHEAEAERLQQQLQQRRQKCATGEELSTYVNIEDSTQFLDNLREIAPAAGVILRAWRSIGKTERADQLEAQFQTLGVEIPVIAEASPEAAAIQQYEHHIFSRQGGKTL